MFSSSKIIKLNSPLFLTNRQKMKKAIYTGIVVLSGIISFTSCRKEYHCNCTYNNMLVYSKDLGNQSHSDAQSICNNYDTTITGETWLCTVN
jgi:hypothetical protein